jgi:cobalt-zinc-cadmium efflux system outer membrane protein
VRTLVVCVFVATAGLGAQAPPPLTLAGAEALALLSNPTIVAARLQRPVDVAAIGVAKERPNPDLSFSANKETPRQSINTSFPIELGGKRGRRVDLAEAVVSSGEAELTRTIAEVQNDVRRAYFQVVADEARVALAVDAQTIAQRARDAAQARFTAGEVAQTDVLQADLALADAEDDVSDARGDAQSSRAELNTLLGQPASTSLVLADALFTGVVPTLADALSQASQVNTELAAIDRHIAEQTARLNVAKSEHSVDLNAGGGISFNGQPDFEVGWRASIGMTVPLFTSHQAGIAVETAELVRLRGVRDARALAIAGEVEAAYARLSSTRARAIQLDTRVLPLSAQVERMAQAAYAAGEKGLSDLLQALQQVRDIRLKALQSSLDFQLALADLEHAIGAPIR